MISDARLDSVEATLGIELFDYQRKAIQNCDTNEMFTRRCLYFKTGAGKSITALLDIWFLGYSKALVIAPPSTHAAWEELGAKVGLIVECMSHAKFRHRGTKLNKMTPVIADEFHLFGGQTGQGWKKLRRLSQGLKAALILASATPNYNDAERVYCIQALLDPPSVAGGFLEFLYRNCVTEQNPYGEIPIVTGFLHHTDAASYLAALPRVDYLPDDLVYTVHDVPYFAALKPAFDELGYDHRKHRIMASDIEARHTYTYNSLVDVNGMLYASLMRVIQPLIEAAEGAVLVYANHATIAEAAMRTWDHRRVSLVTGKTSKKNKERIIEEFRQGKYDVLIGTATLATGTDGLDKVCDTLIILDDTEDDALRRQLIGRIMPRGKSTNVSDKHVYRVVLK